MRVIGRTLTSGVVRRTERIRVVTVTRLKLSRMPIKLNLKLMSPSGRKKRRRRQKKQERHNVGRISCLQKRRRKQLRMVEEIDTLKLIAATPFLKNVHVHPYEIISLVSLDLNTNRLNSCLFIGDLSVIDESLFFWSQQLPRHRYH